MNLEQLEKLNDLKEKGILTQEEFDEKKKELLNGSNTAEAVKAAMPTDGTADFSRFGVIKGSFNAFVSSFKRWNDFKGRTSRFDFFGAAAFLGLVYAIIQGIGLSATLKGEVSVLSLVLSIPVCWIYLTLYIRRLHDTDKSGWWVLTLIVPVIVMFFKGDVETNRFGSAAATNEKKANGALVLAIVFAVVVQPLLLGIFASVSSGFETTPNNIKIEKSIAQVQTMVTNIHTLFTGQKNYSGLKTEILHTMGVVADEACFDAECKNPRNLFGGEILVKSTEGNNYQTFFIGYGGLPQDACVKIASADWGDANSGLVSVAINPQLSQDYIFDARVPEQAARQVCFSANNVIVWEYR